MADPLYAPDGSLQQVDPEQVPDLLQKGYLPPAGKPVSVQHKLTGEIGEVPPEHLKAYLDSGDYDYYGPSADRDDRVGGLGGSVEAVAEGAGETVFGPLVDKALVEAGESPERLKDVAEAHPLLKQGVGTALGLALQAGLGKIGVPTPLGALEGLAGAAAEGLPRAAQLATKSAIEAAGFKASQNISDDIFDNQDVTVANAFHGTTTAALFGLGTGGVLESLAGLAGKYGPKALDKVARAADDLADKAAVNNPDVPGNARKLTGSIQGVLDSMGDATTEFHTNGKADLLDQYLPEATDGSHLTRNVDGSIINAKPGDELYGPISLSDDGQLAGGGPRMRAAVAAVRAIGAKLGETEVESPALNRLRKFAQDTMGRVVTSSTDSEVFQAMDKMKRDFDSFIPDAMDVSGKDFLRNGAMRDARTILQDHLEDPLVYGVAGNYQKEVNAALAPWYDIRKAIRGGAGSLFSKIGKEKIADPGKVETLVNQVASDSTHGDLSSKVLQDFQDRARTAADTIQRTTYDQLGGDVDLSKVLKNLDVLSKDYGEAIDSAIAANKAGAPAGMFGTKVAGGLGAAVGAAAGHVVAGTPGALVGGYLGKAVGKEMWGVARGAQSETIAKIAKIAANSARTISENLTAILGGEQVETKVPEAFKVENYDKLQKSIQAISENPAALQEQVVKHTPVLAKYAPKFSLALAAIAGRTAAYLASEMPRDQEPTPYYKYHPSASEKLEYMHLAWASMDPPAAIIHGLAKGTLSNQDVEAAEAANPQVVELLRQSAMRYLGNHPEVDRRTRMILAPLLKTSLDWDIGKTQQFQALYQRPQGPQQNQGSPPKNQKGTPRFRKAAMGLANRAETGLHQSVEEK